jgi:MFS family permease
MPTHAAVTNRELPAFNFLDAQTRLVRSFFIGMIFKDVMVGGLMVMYASHVLGFSSGETSLILALAPLWLALRYPFLQWVDERPRFKVLIAARVIHIICVFVLLFLPQTMLTPYVILGLSSIFVISNEFLLNAVFINTVTEITQTKERGRFLGRLRSRLQATGLIFSTGVALFVGDHMDQTEHKIILIMSLVLLVNGIFWLLPLHDTQPRPKVAKHQRKLLQVLRHSPLMRRPLALSVIKSLWEWPFIFVYMLNSLSMPAYLLSTFTIVRAVGAIVSVRAWGKHADSVGFRKVFIISFYGSFILYPMLFLLPDYAQVDVHSTQGLAGIAALILFGAISGLMSAGQNVATTLYFTQHLEDGQGFYAINALSALTQLFISGMTALGGLGLAYVEQVGLSAPHATLSGFLWFDPFRGVMVAILVALLLLGLRLAKGIPRAPQESACAQ